MGCEYMLDFEVSDRSEADAVLRTIHGFDGFDAEFELYSFRRSAAGPMADANAKIETAGIYVCDNGGSFQIAKDIQAAFAAIGLRADLREL
jgi:hypothetical protein